MSRSRDSDDCLVHILDKARAEFKVVILDADRVALLQENVSDLDEQRRPPSPDGSGRSRNVQRDRLASQRPSCPAAMVTPNSVGRQGCRAAWIAVSTSDTQPARSLLTFCLS